MGEAKRRQRKREMDFAALDAKMIGDGIDTSAFAFYDQASFLEHERRDAQYLENYARWVSMRPLDDEYENRVRRIVPALGELIADALVEDKWNGSCIAASGMISRILDRLGVWSFAVIGSAVFEVRSRKLWRGLATCDFADAPGAALGHAWVVAPPFQVIDASIFVQRWGADAITSYLPRFIAIESGDRIHPVVDDVVSADMRAEYARRDGGVDPQLHYRLEPNLARFQRDFPAVSTTVDTLTVRYIPVAVRQTDVPLERINESGSIGRTGAQIWTEVVEPHFGSDVVA